MWSETPVCEHCGKEKVNMQGCGWTCMEWDTCPQYKGMKRREVKKTLTEQDVINIMNDYFKEE